MKSHIANSFLILMLLLTGVACSRSSSPVLDYQLPLNGFHLGEYLQVGGPNVLITVNRSPSQTGLVRIQLPSYEMTVLDPNAKEAKDILVSEDRIVYRVNDEIRLWNKKPISLSGTAVRVRSFRWLGTFGRVTYDISEGESRWMSFYEDGKIIAGGTLPGSGRANILKADAEFIVLKNADGLFYAKFGKESEGILEMWPIEKGKGGAYVTARIIAGVVYIAYFDDDAGVLKLAKLLSAANNFSSEIVDGTAGQTYRGMDIAIFNDGGSPGLVYLDGWALKLRWARFISDQWKTEQLPIRGAVGFYNQIIEEESNTITVGLHNFRSQIDDFKRTFENLAILKLQLAN